MAIRIAAVEMTPNPVNAGESVILRVEVVVSNWDWLGRHLWQTVRKFTWKQAGQGEISA